MRLNPLRLTVLVLVLAALAAVEAAYASESGSEETPDMKAHPYVCMCVTVDGHPRHNLLPNAAMAKSRSRKQSAYQGSYTITGNHIDYVDMSTTPAASPTACSTTPA